MRVAHKVIRVVLQGGLCDGNREISERTVQEYELSGGGFTGLALRISLRLQ